ncbi:MAG: hypothetical protein KJZ93_16175 [Caldilineaceae bacterium]|nr:hypothetical protein [Caldilineaceae bacterium]
MTVPKRFGVLRLVGWVFKIIAWIVLVVSILFAIFTALAGGTGLQLLGDSVEAANPILGFLTSAAGGVVAGVVVLLVGALYFLLLYATGESFHLQLALEENTRLTAALLLRMHQDSQQDSRGAYGAAGFEAERFER